MGKNKTKNKNQTIDTATNKPQKINNMINNIKGSLININQEHNTKKESLGPNTKR